MRALLFLLLASCTHDIEIYQPLDVQPARELDILFVLDDSADRGDYAQMASQLGDLQTQLTGVDGVLPSLRVGVVTSDLGVSGTEDAIVVASPVAGCLGSGKGGRLQTFAARPTDRFLEDLRGPDGTRIQNFPSGDLALELRRLTNPDLAQAGCEFEQPLEAMRRALDPETNPGFIRNGAMLAVVFVTSADDCSLARGAMLDPNDASLGPLSTFRCTEQGVICDPDEPRREGTHVNCRPRDGNPFMVDVAEYETFLGGFKADKRDVVVSAVAGPRDTFRVGNIGAPVLRPSCQGSGGQAVPAVRIGSLVDRFGGVTVDACTQEAAYQQLTAPIVNRQRSCFPGLARGADDACTVMETAGGIETVLDRCADGDPGPCWDTFADATACPDGDNLGIAIRRGAAAGPASGRFEARCFVK